MNGGDVAVAVLSGVAVASLWATLRWRWWHAARVRRAAEREEEEQFWAFMRAGKPRFREPEDLNPGV
jgi:hypothetical protein